MRLFVLATAVLVLAAGCGGGKSTQATTPAVSAPTSTGATVVVHGRFRYPQVLIRNYMSSCVGKGAAKRAYCACTLDRLSNHVSTADFMRIGLAHGRIPPRIKRWMTRAALACAGNL